MQIFSKGFKPKWLAPVGENFRYGYLLDLNTDEIAYVTQASEAAFIVSKQDRKEVKLEILKENHRHSDEKIFFAFHESASNALSEIVGQKLPNGDAMIRNLDVEFEVKHSYFNNLVKAVNKISSAIIKRIMPTSSDFLGFANISDKEIKSLLSELPYFVCNTPNDEDQFRALRKVLLSYRNAPPIVIKGMFGTGKTQLLAKVAYCVTKYGILHKHPVRVLICAHHQATADLFVENYFGPMFLKHDIEVVRLTSKRYSYNRSQFNSVYQTSQDYVSKYIKQELPLPQYLVLVTTFLTAPSLLGIDRFKEGAFTHILLDEGSQVREPEAIAPLSLAGPDTKLVIAGDSCQVCLFIVHMFT